MNRHLSIGRLAKVILCGVLWQACATEEEDLSGDATETGVDASDNTIDSGASEVSAPDLYGDENDDCHIDCFGGEGCSNGAMYYSAFGAAPCWATETYEGMGVCLRSIDPCPEAACGIRGVACRDTEASVWPGPIDENEMPIRGVYSAGYDRELGSVMTFYTSNGRVGAESDGMLDLTLSECEFEERDYDPYLPSVAECQMSLERLGQPVLETRSLVLLLASSFSDWKAGSITWVEGSRLLRLDWWSDSGIGYAMNFVLHDNASGPVPDWAPPTEPEEGSGGVDEGSGGVDEGSGGVDEGSGSVDEGSGVMDEGSGGVDEGSGGVDEGSGV